jgi:hypothetical protein
MINRQVSLLASALAAVLLAACGASPPPIGASGSMPQRRAIATHAERGGSWMLPEAQSEDLLYVATSRNNQYSVSVFSYRSGRLVGELKGFSGYVSDLCSDSAGDVFVPTFDDGSIGYIYKYPHGSLSPSQTLTAPGSPLDCAVDATTGNLAAVVSEFLQPYGLAIFANAQGTPTVLYPSNMYYIFSCAYDNAGNVYVDGSEGDSFQMSLAEIPTGDTAFTSISVNDSIDYPQTLEWDGQYLTVAILRRRAQKHVRIDRFVIAGFAATLASVVELRSKNNDSQDVILDHTLIEAGANKPFTVGAWAYPRGGKPLRGIAQVDGYPLGIALSIAKKS